MPFSTVGTVPMGPASVPGSRRDVPVFAVAFVPAEVLPGRPARTSARITSARITSARITSARITASATAVAPMTAADTAAADISRAAALVEGETLGGDAEAKIAGEDGSRERSRVAIATGLARLHAAALGGFFRSSVVGERASGSTVTSANAGEPRVGAPSTR